MSRPSEAPVPDTMEGLRRQNSAYRALCASLEDRQAIHTAEGRKYHEAVSTLESERQANAILTEENARLSKERDMAVEALKFYGHEHEWPNEGPWGVDSTDFGHIARATLAQLEASKEHP